jgi:DNA-binding transcriptional regulator YdaS (Cro superfamily)
MQLNDFFDKEGVSPAKFAIENNISITSIYRYMRKETCPSRERAKIIEKATKGKVSVAELRGGYD